MPMATMPKVIKDMVISESAIIQDGTCSSRLLKKTSTTPSASSGPVISQNLLHNSARNEIGELCKIQKALPSKLIAGKAKRTATALKTNPASARLAKETTVRIVPAGMGERSSGRTLKL